MTSKRFIVQDLPEFDVKRLQGDSKSIQKRKFRICCLSFGKTGYVNREGQVALVEKQEYECNKNHRTTRYGRCKSLSKSKNNLFHFFCIITTIVTGTTEKMIGSTWLYIRLLLGAQVSSDKLSDDYH